MSEHTMTDLDLCPFCGGPADIEEIAPKYSGGRDVSFSVGCRNMDGPDECIGQQSLLTFARKSDAVKAWNTRSTSASERGLREALEWYGEQARLCRLIHSEGDAGRHALADDGGKRARAALSPKGEG